MHTFICSSCRIHHNSDYSGEIVITNNKTSINSTMEDLFSKFCKCNKETIKSNTMQIKDTTDDNFIIVQFANINYFFKTILMIKINKKIDSDNCSFDTIKQIADILKIKF